MKGLDILHFKSTGKIKPEKKGGSAGKVLGASALIAATGGLAVPLLGLAVPSAIINGLSVITTIGVVENLSDAKKFKKENETLREELKKANIDSRTKQKIIEELNKKLEQVGAALKKETAKVKRNEEKIRFLEEQLDDLMETLQTAYVA